MTLSRSISAIVAIAIIAGPAFSQTASLRGQVTDQTQAIIPGATVILTGSDGVPRATIVGKDGSYVLANLPAGNYTANASAPGLALRQPVQISLKPGPQTLNLSLNVVAEKQQVTVEEQGTPAVSTEAAANASAVVLRGADLDALSDNPDDLAADLQALAAHSQASWRPRSQSGESTETGSR